MSLDKIKGCSICDSTSFLDKTGRKVKCNGDITIFGHCQVCNLPYLLTAREGYCRICGNCSQEDRDHCSGHKLVLPATLVDMMRSYKLRYDQAVERKRLSGR